MIEFTIAMSKTDRRKLMFAFFLTILGLTLHFETAILIFMKAYVYYPMIIRAHPNPFNDVLAGNLFSQFSVSATALLMVVLRVKAYWYAIIAGIYVLIEQLFLALGIYKHHWYQTWMTFAFLIIFFWLANKIFVHLERGTKKILYYGYVYMGLFPLNVITIIWEFQLSGYLDFSTTLLRDSLNSRYLLYVLYFQSSALIMMLVYFSRLKSYWKSLLIFILYASYFIAYNQNLIRFSEGTFLFVTTITIVWMYASIYVLDKLYGRPTR